MSHPGPEQQMRSTVRSRLSAHDLARRVCALVGAGLMAMVLALLPAGAGNASVAQASVDVAGQPSQSPTQRQSPTQSQSPSPSKTPTQSKSPSPSKSPKPKPGHPGGAPPTPRGGAVVRGPRMWNAVKNHYFSSPSYVTVSQAGSLVNEVVKVKWQGFTPSQGVPYVATSTYYPVMIAECSVPHPTKRSQCFGINNSGAAAQESQYGPYNTVYATTSPNGTGVAYIQLLTSQEAPNLGCDEGHECSLIVDPADGGNAGDGDCRDHSEDEGLFAYAAGQFAFGPQYGICAWRDRIIVPLHFSPTPTDCPVRGSQFSAIGSPMLVRAMTSWQTALCSAASPVVIRYDGTQGEPLARQDFTSSPPSTDVAFTTLPVSGTGGSPRPFTYAPVAITAESVAFYVDDARTGKQDSHLRLDPRLVLKLLTQSFDFGNEGCGNGPPPKGRTCDNGVDNDPTSIFADPEFRKLNPHFPPVSDANAYEIPTVLSGESDMTTELTTWIAKNKAAKSFAGGSFDPWGAHINSWYLGMTLPTNSLSSFDPFPPIERQYVPVFPLSAVAQDQVNNQSPGTQWTPQANGSYAAFAPEVPGTRSLFAILDQPDAASYLMPVASLENPAGNYVTPTAATMTAALGDMTTSKNHITQQFNFKNTSKEFRDAYPLTMVIYAMVPTGGISKRMAAKIAQWLDYVAGPGQTPGYGPGELPPGYLPLTAKMRAQTLKAASEVLNRTGDKRKSKGKGSKGSQTPSTTPSSSASAGPSSRQRVVSLGYDGNPGSSGLARYALLILLIAGALLAVAGSSALAIGRSGTAAVAWLRRMHLLPKRLPEPRLRRRTKP
jgi:hypothetical protein